MAKKIINKIFKYAAFKEASEISLENKKQGISLEYFFQGNESHSFTLPKKLEKDLNNSLEQIFKLTSNELVKKKYCRFLDSNYRLSFYLSITPSEFGNRITIKIIPKEKQLLRLNQLGMEREQLKTLKSLLKKKSGLIIISSPDNQGKSTTLNAVIKELDSPKISAYSLGLNLENEFENINCLEANNYNWDKILNLDSDIIIAPLNSEINWQKAITAANTGRLVLGLASSDSSWKILETILKLKRPLKEKIDNLHLIINQRIYPLKRSLNAGNKKKRLSRKNIALFEFLEINKNIKNFLLESKSKKDKSDFWHKTAKLATINGYHSLKEDYRHKKKNGLIV